MKKKYTGVLARPIKYVGKPTTGTRTLINSNASVDEHYDFELSKRLEALFLHYGLKPQLAPRRGSQQIEIWDLMLALAREHVPGFAIAAPNRGGRPMHFEECKFVFVEVERWRQTAPSLTVEAACSKIRTQFRVRFGVGRSVKDLSNRYYGFLRHYCLPNLRTPKQKLEMKNALKKLLLETPDPPSS